jgi:hypothetical protein
LMFAARMREEILAKGVGGCGLPYLYILLRFAIAF